MTQAATTDLVLTNAAVVTMADGPVVLSPGHVAVAGDRIAAVAGGAPAPGAFPGARVLNLEGRVILPGLVNCHMHQRPVRALGDGLPLKTWHDRCADGATERMTPADAYAGALLGFGDCLRGGITTVLADTIFPEDEARAARDIGIRARMFPHIEDPRKVEPYLRLVESQAGSEADRVRLWAGVEAAARMDPGMLRLVAQTARTMGGGIATHFSEARRESVDALRASGILGPTLSLAHCVQVTPSDIAVLAQHGACVVHNPKSNLRLANGVAPVPEMMAAGLRVALGTDGMVSTYRLDLFEEMRTAALLQRGVRRDPLLLPVEQLLAMVTTESAALLLHGDRIGRLAPGMKADITVLDARKLWWTPRVDDPGNSNLLGLIVWSAVATDVEMVLVDGAVVVEGGRLVSLDEDAVRAGAQAAGARIIRAGGLARRD
jgi:5-methylthioadenosine/S-adenosylhomocysteine deaminase